MSLQGLLVALSTFTSQWLQGLIGLSLKGAAVLLIAGVAVLLLKRSSASARHLVLCVALCSLPALPIIELTAPKLAVPVLPEELVFYEAPDSVYLTFFEAEQNQGKNEDSRNSTPSNRRSNEADSSGSARAGPNSSGSLSSQSDDAYLKAGNSGLHWSAWVLLAWGAGALVVLLQLAKNYLKVAAVIRAAESAVGDFERCAQQLSAEIGLRRPVRLLFSELVAMPIVVGVVRPHVVLPASGKGWAPELRRSVLLHELAHLKRSDMLTRLLAQIACIVYWFNPLVWLTAHRLAVESERAADDIVLNSQTKPSAYAFHLLELAKAMRAAARPSWAVVSMARQNNFKERVMAILDSEATRRTPSRRLRLAMAVFTLIVIFPLAAMQPWCKSETETEPAEIILQEKKTGQKIKLGMSYPNEELRQGDPILIKISPVENIAHAEGTFLDRQLTFAEDNGQMVALAAIGRDTPVGIHRLSLKIVFNDKQESKFVKEINVKIKEFRYLKIAFGKSSKWNVSEMQQYQEFAIKEVLSKSSNTKLWQLPFAGPVEDRQVSFGFGHKITDSDKDYTWIHEGVDLRMPSGTPLHSCTAGRVVLAKELGGHGKLVIIDHGLGVFTGYSHLSKIDVTDGQTVEKGEVIGLSGNTGRSTNPHLHWMLIVNGVYCDPLGILEL